MEGDSFIQSYPWIQWNIFYTLSQNTGFKDIIDNLKDKHICAYCDGWLVIEDIKMHHLYLINVKSSEKIRLPSMNFDYYTCILTHSPADFGCHVLFLTNDTILYCRLGDKKYKTHKLEKSMHIKNNMVAALEGKVYYGMDSAFPKLVMIECNGSTLQFTKLEILPFFINEVVSPSNTPYLVESSGELLLVLASYRPICTKDEDMVNFILVFQFDFMNMSWMQVEDIGNSTIFLPRSNGYGAISFSATEPQIKRNSIYFLDDTNDYVHNYDMNNRSFSLFSNGLNMVTLHVQEEFNDILYYEKQNMELLSQMHSDVSKLVLARVFMLDPGVLGVIRSTCKDWGSIVRPPTYDIDLRYNKYPYLMTLINGTCKFFHPTYNHTFCLDTPELLGSHIMFSKFGWLLLSRIKETERTEYFFFNLFTRQKMSLPNPDPFWKIHTMSFSSPPTSSHCFVVAVDYYGLTLAIFKCGEDSWKIFETLRIPGRVVNIHPVFHKQKCYFFGLNKNLIVVDLTTRNLFVVGKTYSAELPMFDECFLVKDGKGLLAVFVPTKKKTPYLMRMDLSQTKKKWQPLQNLNYKMVYVSHAACRSVLAPTNSTGCMEIDDAISGSDDKYKNAIYVIQRAFAL